MNHHLQIDRDEGFLRRYDYGDRVVIAADLPVADEAVDVDVVGDTAIVVIERNGRIAESELDLPHGETSAGVNNGVLTIEIETDRTEDAIGSGDDSTELDEDA
ncbi:hypothetical protein AArcSl_0450 [Halalkaliarchaeum desulfuricum]|uniref:Hsp20/alpha crystallin family protein n=1 Tax=Halalkaliarchaeum desulfuricum TaxID=2055893 RepID=A0A343TG81_9EURY|nr:Hsp20/alpha crystallin family protein [Halalkaliarchaeum desulfuricum]AUX08103.1 hypothetical protein AArcSl_0450 [Halalkaliarchaeum desulfuricum]